MHIECFVEYIQILNLLVDHGAVLNYEEFSRPNEIAANKALFYTRKALECSEKIDMYLVYKSMKDFLHIVFLSGKLSPLLQIRLESSFTILTKLLLSHGLSTREKAHLFDQARSAKMLEMVLNSMSHEQYYHSVQLLRQRYSDNQVPPGQDWRNKDAFSMRVNNPRGLRQICRVVIQNQLGKIMTHKLDTIPLPTPLKIYILSFSD